MNRNTMVLLIFPTGWGGSFLRVKYNILCGTFFWKSVSKLKQRLVFYVNVKVCRRARSKRNHVVEREAAANPLNV